MTAILVYKNEFASTCMALHNDIFQAPKKSLSSLTFPLNLLACQNPQSLALTAQPHELVRNRWEKQMNDRNKRPSSLTPYTPFSMPFAYSEGGI